ncbi:hypothetical protein B2M27_15540 (plasmid) [Kluyvera intermedia]|uniref:Uncharacterized protein n=1 Tax=Kluyvera intermedia TaxID=61648 RepID=A0ABX3UDR0_KLUIN|nr:hypothetical protein [Kluyvera intermedia]ORJ49419.1 hypothetical protein B2M27_15540 [Kluyvera intermedia]
MHTQNVNVKTAGEETAGRWGKNTSAEKGGTEMPDSVSAGQKYTGFFGRVLRAIDSADYDVACEQEACHHYGDPFTRINHFTTWISGFVSAFHSHLS